MCEVGSFSSGLITESFGEHSRTENECNLKRSWVDLIVLDTYTLDLRAMISHW